MLNIAVMSFLLNPTEPFSSPLGELRDHYMLSTTDFLSPLQKD